MTLRNSIAAALLLLLITLLGYGLVNNLERETQVIDQGPDTRVRRNDYFAAGLFLQQQGHSVKHSRFLVSPETLGAKDALILTDVEFLAGSSERARRLLQWVQGGGHLVWSYPSNDYDNPLAILLGVVRQEVESPSSPEEGQDNLESVQAPEPTPVQSSGEQEQQAGGAQNSEITNLRAEISAREAEIDSRFLGRLRGAEGRVLNSIQYGNWFLQQDLSVSSGDYSPVLEAVARSEQGGQMLLMGLGAGQVTVVKDAKMWSNRHLGMFDHAHLLAWLVRGNDSVHVQRYSQWPSLSQLIWRHAREALLASLLLFLVWVMCQGRRFGPVKTATIPLRRTLAEHVEAVARFHHRYGQIDHLLDPLRRQILRRAASAQLDFDQLKPEQQRQAVLNLADIQQEGALQALIPQGQYNTAELVDTVKLLIRIRNRL
ncbi:DUF4350 domain-containing protein [Marinobacterium stanieri]|uniref:DUF4350 domain-containing protein n=1 Tax=Marinobacterium stanieri TaxID=49186 RepID=A0A1N6W934_9GAMM|nr:DUF4350 domain-containing protein [Marinobacterium stanieri]SIQ86651.1 hypothetical protein SAMN05421647_11043 [Marinobacterium stanieri]